MLNISNPGDGKAATDASIYYTYISLAWVHVVIAALCIFFAQTVMKCRGYSL